MRKYVTMDYLQAANRYDLDKFINQIKDLDYLEVIHALTREISAVESGKITLKPEYKRDIESLQISYISNLKGLGFLLGQGMRPFGVEKNILTKFKPVLLGLIEKKQMNETILSMIE